MLSIGFDQCLGPPGFIEMCSCGNEITPQLRVEEC
jgi:hypothetical protein